MATTVFNAIGQDRSTNGEKTTKTKEETNTYRKTSIIVGLLFIIGTAAGFVSGFLAVPILEGPDCFMNIAANEYQFVIGTLFVLIMGFSVTMIPVILFPISLLNNTFGG